MRQKHNCNTLEKASLRFLEMSGALKVRTQREKPTDKGRDKYVLESIKSAPSEVNKEFWKFYLGYNAYQIEKTVLKTFGTLPEIVIHELSFGERRLLHYITGKKQHTGCCYITQRGSYTHRFLSVKKLIHKGIVAFESEEENIIYFRIADQFSGQHKFNISTGKYIHK